MAHVATRDLSHIMSIPTSRYSFQHSSDSFYSSVPSDQFDQVSPKKRIRLDKGEQQYLRASGDSLTAGPSNSLQQLRGRQVALGLDDVAVASDSASTTASIDAAPLIPLLDICGRGDPSSRGSVLPGKGEMSFQQDTSQSTPEPGLLPADEWGSGDFVSMGPSAQSEYASEQRSEEGTKRKRDSTGGTQIVIPPNISDDQRLLLELRDERNLPWKDIALKFQSELGRNDRVPALQMRYKRLKERLRVWTETDIDALAKAVEYWEQKKFEIVSEKMLEFGVSEKWPARHCASKWQEISASTEQRPLDFETEFPSFNLPSQTTSPDPQSSQSVLHGSLVRSSSFSTSSRARPDITGISHSVTINPVANRLAGDSYSSERSTSQFSTTPVPASQSPGMHSYISNYNLQGAPQSISPRTRVQPSPMRSSPGLMSTQSQNLLTPPMYSVSCYSDLSTASSTQGQQSVPSDHPYGQASSSHHIPAPHQQSPSYNQMGQPDLSGYHSANLYNSHNRQGSGQYSTHVSGATTYMSQQPP